MSYTFRALVEVWHAVSIGSCQLQVLYGRKEEKKWHIKRDIYKDIFFFLNFPTYNPQLADELLTVTCAHSRPHFCSRLGVSWLQIKQSSALSLIQG